MIRDQALPGFGFRETATRLEDGRRELAVDDDVVVRLVRAAIGQKAH